MSEPIIEGGCLCGAIRYRITGPVDDVVHCHCSMCRRSSGGAVMTWLVVPTASFAVTRGELAVFKSSEHSERRFCPGCGAQITFWTARWPEETDVTVGTLDSSGDRPATHHIFAGDRIPWLKGDDHLPAYKEVMTDGE